MPSTRLILESHRSKFLKKFRAFTRMLLNGCKTRFLKLTRKLIQSRNPELFNETRFFTFRPLFDDIEPFEVDLLSFAIKEGSFKVH